MKPAIEVDGLSKQYRLGGKAAGYRTLRESVMAAVAGFGRSCGARWRPQRDRVERQEKNLFWALKDINFAVQPGEVVGLIGRNGSGKSTLLKILSRITEPTSGQAVVRGRLGSLLEVGTGFHNELTGRENIYLNGSILGMTRREITRKFDEIVAFAEMEQFLDTPVKRYSSGMYVRLAFAVAAHLDLDTMLVDEVLAVGDLDFQKRCMAKMGTIARGGRTVIFVSHNLGQIHRMCDRAILLRHGQVIGDGSATDVIQAYLRDSQSHEGCWERPEDLSATKEVALRGARILAADGRTTGVTTCEAGFRVEIDYEVRCPIPNFEVGFTVRNTEGVAVVSSLDCDTAVWPDRTRQAGRYSSVCVVPGHLLAPGCYFLTLAAHVANQQTFEIFQDVLAFEVAVMGCIRTKRNDSRPGLITPVFDWEIIKTS